MDNHYLFTHKKSWWYWCIFKRATYSAHRLSIWLNKTYCILCMWSREYILKELLWLENTLCPQTHNQIIRCYNQSTHFAYFVNQCVNVRHFKFQSSYLQKLFVGYPNHIVDSMGWIYIIVNFWNITSKESSHTPFTKYIEYAKYRGKICAYFNGEVFVNISIVNNIVCYKYIIKL